MARLKKIYRSDESEVTAERLLAVIGDLQRQLRAGKAPSKTLTLDSSLEKDLGLDSLGRTELLLRLENRFGVNLSEQTLTLETPRELLRAVLTASGTTGAASDSVQYAAPSPTESAPERAATLLDVLDWHLQAHPERVYLQLYENDETPVPLSYAELAKGARCVAAGLREQGLEPGQTVAVMLPTGRDYFFSFFGILLAGGAPVPIYPPVRASQIEEHLRRHARILDNARSAILITVPEARTVARLLKAQVAALRHVTTVAELGAANTAHWIAPLVKPQDIAFIQYTSGSTGDPKGVVLNHANLLANIRAMGQRVQISSTDVFVSWLPLYHDMGLIGGALGTLYYAFPLVVMSPLKFLKRPDSWLWAIHRHGGTVSAAPNFAYELCLRNIDEAALTGLDLSTWRWAMNGAEPVSVDTMRRFGERFARYGLRAEALAPVYGLAECCLGLALPLPGRGLRVDRIRRDEFMRSGRAEPAADTATDVLQLAACGHAVPGHQIRIVDDGGRELPDRREGRLEFKGPSATAGYLRNPEASAKLFNGDWLSSGDRAYTVDGDVFLSGRIKDVIIRGGRNIYPYELEQVVGEIDGVRKGCVAVFASTDEQSGTERLVVVAETRVTDESAKNRMRDAIRETSVDLLGMAADEIMLAPPHTVLKTSSGKIRRSAMRDLYQRRALTDGAKSLWWQLARVLAASAWPQLRRSISRLGELLYAGYGWILFVLAGLLLLLPVSVLSAHRGLALCGAAVRVLARLAGIRLTVQGIERLPVAGGCVLVANHASYLDSLILAAAIPRYFSFVAKRELAENAVIGRPLKRLGTVFVERFDLTRATADAARIADIVDTGQSLAFFPEGTFYRTPGLQPFRMGAFWAAAQTGAPVVPVTIRGARTVLRADSWFPRRGAVRVIIDDPIPPQGSDWAAAVRLRDAARAVIQRQSGEPDLSLEKASD